MQLYLAFDMQLKELVHQEFGDSCLLIKLLISNKPLLDQPPSTGILTPVKNEAASLHKKATTLATSAALPHRFKNE
jgi:hypothetical protein